MEKSMHTGIVFRPKIGDHLRKGENVSVNSYTTEEIQELVKLRAADVSYTDCSIKLSKSIGSIGNMIHYYKLQPKIDEAKGLL
jgi:hypothetical protein